MNYNIELKWGGDSIIESSPQLIKIHYLFRSSVNLTAITFNLINNISMSHLVE
jgi:hypothetical protein